MNIKLTKRVNGIAESATLAISAKAKRLKDEGVDVVNFGVGEPDFNTPDYIIEAAISAMKNGLTKYTPASGIPDLKRAVAEETERALGIRFQPEQVVIGAGAKQPLYNAIASIVEEGDEVIIPVPYWVTYPELVKYLGGKGVFVQTKPENSYKITAEELREAITPRTRAFILNSPNNPTGAVYSSAELKALSDEITRRDGIFVISDELYRNQKPHDNRRRNEQILRDDRLESGLGDSSARNCQSHDEGAKPYHFQRQFHRAICVACRAYRKGKLGKVHFRNARYIRSKAKRGYRKALREENFVYPPVRSVLYSGGYIEVARKNLCGRQKNR